MTSSSEGVDSPGTTVTIGVICVLAVLSNMVVVALTLRKPSNQRSAINLFIVNLAASDLVLAAVTMPLILMDANIPEFTKSEPECKFKMALPLFNMCSSVCTMVLMSCDRLRVIVQGKSTSRQQALGFLLATWLLALVMTAPQLYEYRLVHQPQDGANLTQLSCSSDGRDPLFLQTYASLVLTLAYLLPLALLSRNYVIVIFFVTKKARLLQGQVSRAKIRVLRSIITVTVAFVVLWLPFFVLFTIEEVTGTDNSMEFTSTPHVIKQTFVSLSALVNPVIYFSLMPDYRRAFKLLLLPLCCCPSRVTPVSQDIYLSSSSQPGQPEVAGRQELAQVWSGGRPQACAVNVSSPTLQPAPHMRPRPAQVMV